MCREQCDLRVFGWQARLTRHIDLTINRCVGFIRGVLRPIEASALGKRAVVSLSR